MIWHANSHAVQIDRWLKIQHILNLSDELPASKIFKRPALLTEALVVTTNGD